jgi:hypothetical protein
MAGTTRPYDVPAFLPAQLRLLNVRCLLGSDCRPRSPRSGSCIEAFPKWETAAWPRVDAAHLLLSASFGAVHPSADTIGKLDGAERRDDGDIPTDIEYLRTSEGLRIARFDLESGAEPESVDGSKKAPLRGAPKLNY